MFCILLFIRERHRREIKFSIVGTLQWLKMKPKTGAQPVIVHHFAPDPGGSCLSNAPAQPVLALGARCERKPGKVEMFLPQFSLQMNQNIL